MSSFTALMALSASKTQEQNNLAQIAVQERQRKEKQLRKQREEQEAKQRELEKKLRLQHFENERREQERKKKMEEEKVAREAVLQRRKDEQRDALLYGPKKAASTKASSLSGGGAAVKEKRRLLDDDNDDDSSPGNILTRQELRDQRLQAQMRRLYGSTRKSTSSQSYTRPGRRLPGGAVDVQTTPQSPEALAGKSVKDRLAAMPNTLTKLNTVKRDTRTIDEIVADIAKKKDGKVLDGDSAKSFDDWFSMKKKDPVKRVSTSSSPNSGATTPTSSAPTSSALAKKAVVSSSAAMTARSSAMKTPVAKMSGQQTTTSSKAANGLRGGPFDKHPPAKAPSNPLPSKSSRLSSAAERDRDRDRDRFCSSRPSASAVPSHMKKRPRSESRSESPPSKKRAVPAEEDLPDDLSSTIWSIFGRKRDRYMAMDVFSDDEEMEADADALEREEKFSARLARKEDMQALEDERRHEEEKRKRKKEKERFGRLGQ